VAVPDMKEILGQLRSIEQRLTNQTQAMLKIAEHKLEVILANAVFRNPLVLIQNSWQQLDDLSADLEEFIKALLTKAHRELSAAYEQIIRIEPHRLLGYKSIELNNLQNCANMGIRAAVNNCRMQLTAQENRLSALNPRSVLQRGYSITTNKMTGLLIKTSEDVHIGDYLITELSNENLIESEVKKK